MMTADEIREALVKMTPGLLTDEWTYSCGVLYHAGTSAVVNLDRDDWEGIVTLRNKVPLLLEELAAEKAAREKAEAEVVRLREALELADAALSGANMNMRVVERKVRAALGGGNGR